MKLLGFQKYFLFLMLSLGIAQISIAFVSKSDVSSTKKSTSFHSNQSQSGSTNFIFDLVEEINDDDSNETQHSIDFTVSSTNSFTFLRLQKETILNPKLYATTFLHNQKINILNCTFLI